MRTLTRILTGFWFSFIACSLLLGSSVATAQEVYICVWRNPERTMTRLFPDAADYRTVTRPISAEQLAAIEERTGSAVLPGQREQFQYFEMLDREGGIIGHTIAMTQKGEFGAIEFVFGLTLENRLLDMYIQRARERDRSFRQDEFLAHFPGVGIAEADTLPDPAGDKGTIATGAVTLGIRKGLIVFEEVVLKAGE